MDGSRVAPALAPRAAERLPLPVSLPVVLPAGTRLLHVGPHKTGTSSVQSAFHLARATLAAQGVRYAGPNRHPVRAAQAAIARDQAGERRGADLARPIRPWRNLLRDIERTPEARVVISSEWFADATPEAARRIVAELGPSRTHVVVTLRPLTRILPSQWQQYVQAGSSTPYERWLASVLGEPPDPAAAAFWHRHRHDALIARWAAVVGPGAVTAIIADDRDHDAVLRVFERLTGLRPGTLVAEDSRINRSLTLPETELVRTINQALPPGLLDPVVRLNLVLYGASAALRARTPRPGEARIETPGWAHERARAVGREIAAGIATTGVAVVGDLADLAGEAGSGPSPEPQWPDAAGWADMAAVAAVGVLRASGNARTGDANPEATVAISTPRLAEVLAGRVVGHALAPLAWVVDRGARTARRQVTASGAPDRRPLAAAERATIEALDAAVRTERIDPGTRATVLDAAEQAMRERGPAVGGDDGPGAGPRIGAAAVLGVVRAAGLVARQPGLAVLRAPILAQRRRTTGETLELARLSTATLGGLLARRLVARLATDRGRAPRER